MNKRACIVRHNYYPTNILVHREALALQEYGFDVDIICLRGRGEAPVEDVDGIHVVRVPLRRVKGGTLRYIYDYVSFFLVAMFVLTMRHLRRRYAVIQVNSMPDFLVFATLFARWLGAKVVLLMYEPTPELWASRLGIDTEEDLRRSAFRYRALTKVLRWIEQLSLRYADAVLATTEQHKQNYVKHGADPDKIDVILNAPESRLFDVPLPSTDKASAPDEEHFVLISHGAIEERYGHDTMLQAIHLVKDSIPGVQLRISGTGSYRDTFLQNVERLDLQAYVVYLGYISWEQLMLELRQADVGIVARKSSMCSNLEHTCKMYDFIDFGKPVISSRLRAVEAYFDDDSLCFFEPGDAEDLARAILTLYQDPDRRRALVQNAQQYYQQYRWKKQREIYWATYARLEQEGTS